jgi:hypothetical protein
MNFGEVKAYFQGALNRRDITPTQVGEYIKASCRRAQRLLRVPAAESSLEYYIEPPFFGKLFIPGDYLKMVSLTTEHGHELRKADPSTVSRLSQYEGYPQFYARVGPEFVIGPKPKAGTTIKLLYQVDLGELSADTDTNWLLTVAPDVVVNGALSAACMFYVDPRRDGYEADFTRDITDLNIQAADDELTNAALMPTHSFDFGEC